MRRLILVLVLGTACKVATRRTEDPLEPNDAPQAATALPLDAPLEGRANEGNPDVFAVEVDAPGRLQFKIEDRGHEDCAHFTIVDPSGAELYADGNATCGRKETTPARTAEGARFDREASAYVLEVPAAAPGRYLLTIVELGAADNELAYSWDYRVTASAAERQAP